MLGDIKVLVSSPYYGNTKFEIQIGYYTDSGEAILDDRSDNYEVDAVVVDIETGEEKARCNTGTRISAKMFWGAGYQRDAYMGDGVAGTLVRIFVKDK